MRFIPPRRWSIVAGSAGLACAIQAISGCSDSTPPAAANAEAKPVQAASAKTPAGKGKSRLKNVSPLGDLGVRELRALKKSQQTEKTGQE
jgi:hypothetical protein